MAKLPCWKVGEEVIVVYPITHDMHLAVIDKVTPSGNARLPHSVVSYRPNGTGIGYNGRVIRRCDPDWDTRIDIVRKRAYIDTVQGNIETLSMVSPSVMMEFDQQSLVNLNISINRALAALNAIRKRLA